MASSTITAAIAAARREGKSPEAIYLMLLQQGHTVADIQKAYSGLERENRAAATKEDTQKRTVTIIVTIGALLVGAGVFSFIASNWQEMTRGLRLGIILVAMVTSYAAGWFFKEQQHMPRLGEALYLLGAIIYGAGIFLVAQMFNIRANWPDGFILWMLGAIALAWVVESPVLWYGAVLLGVTAVISHPIVILDGLSGHNPFLLTSSLLLIVTTVVTFAVGWALRNRMPDDLKKLY